MTLCRMVFDILSVLTFEINPFCPPYNISACTLNINQSRQIMCDAEFLGNEIVHDP